LADKIIEDRTYQVKPGTEQTAAGSNSVDWNTSTVRPSTCKSTSKFHKPGQCFKYY